MDNSNRPNSDGAPLRLPKRTGTPLPMADSERASGRNPLLNRSSTPAPASKPQPPLGTSFSTRASAAISSSANRNHERAGDAPYDSGASSPPQPPMRRRGGGALLLWLLLPLLMMAAGGWWIYDSLITRNLTFETKTVLTSGNTVVDAVRRVNKQVFIEHYDTIDLDYRQAPQNWLQYLGVEQSFVVLLRGRVPAGFDLQTLNESNVWISTNGKQAQLTLPPPIVFEESVSIDFERSRILAINDTCPDLICENAVLAYQNQLLPEGREMLIDSAIEDGILNQVAEDGKAFYEQLLRTLGFDEVRVVVAGY